MGITLMRLGVSSAVLVAVLRPRPWRWSRDAQQATLLFGLCMAGMNIVFYLALRTVPLGVCVTVEFLGPLTVALVQTRRWRDLFWVCLADTRAGQDVQRPERAGNQREGQSTDRQITAAAQAQQGDPGCGEADPQHVTPPSGLHECHGERPEKLHRHADT